MSILIALDNISLAFGLDHLLDHVKLQVRSGERVCLIGRNGAGKSSLLSILDGTLKPDSGTIWRKPALRMARLEQELPRDVTHTVYEYVADGLAEIGRLLAQYHALLHRLETSHDEADLNQLERLQHGLDVNNGWQFEQTIHTTLTKLELPADTRVCDLSGGWQRRAALARTWVSAPELLLLDEPTNHLDIEAIQWLEDQLVSDGTTLVFITHDRSLLERLATRIIELDRGHLTSWPGDYQNFLRRKEEMLHAEEMQHAVFDKKLAQEERWIRQGIKARRTRNEGRVRALEAMRATRAKRREVQGKVSFSIQEAEKSGQLIVDAENIDYAIGDKVILKNFSLRIMRGDRIGLLGPNGVGKTTLLNILLGKLEPQRGSIRQGTKLRVAYFDQLRATLDLEKTVAENVAQGSDIIEIGEKRQHIIGYLSDFLFTPQRAMTPVKALSGGESNRLLLAKLFSQAANVLVLDEPTNDLDIETLELLEELLESFKGTVLLVSHDRAFLDNVVTSTLVFEGNGKVQEFIGGYQDWLRQVKVMAEPVKTEKITVKERSKHTVKKRSYKEQKEMEELPLRIEKLEAEQLALQQQISEPSFYQNDPKIVAETLERLKQLEMDLEKSYLRWAELE